MEPLPQVGFFSSRLRSAYDTVRQRAVATAEAVEAVGGDEKQPSRNHHTLADLAHNIDRRRKLRRAYLEELVKKYRFYIEPGCHVLELGVGTGDLLASLRAARAVGVDINAQMVEVAGELHPELELHHANAASLDALHGPFDYIILSDLAPHLHDAAQVLRGLHRLSHPRTRIIVNFHSRAWQRIFRALEAVDLLTGQRRYKWISPDDMESVCRQAHSDNEGRWLRDGLT